MKKIIASAILLLVLTAVVGVAVTTKTDETPKHEVASTSQSKTEAAEQGKPLVPTTVTVDYSESGFSPQAITGASGSTVNYINHTQIPLWVASDPHPEHTDYPGFDAAAQGSVPEPGQNFSFTFTKKRHLALS